MLLRRALPAAHFDRNAAIPVTDLVHWYRYFNRSLQLCHEELVLFLIVCHFGPALYFDPNLFDSDSEVSQN
jgi:hypothetical protein